MFYQFYLDLIGHTPLLRLDCFAPGANLLAKVEGRNPGGSAKDRVALEMILDAERRGVLTEGATIIEPTSGNTGIGLAWVGRSLGYEVILTMPETMSAERVSLCTAFGARVVLTEGAKGMAGSVEKAKELQKTLPNAVILGQFENPANPMAHYKTTGPEIWEDTQGQVDVLVATVGTGGTLSGTARYLREKNPNLYVVAVEPAASPLLSGGVAGPHKIQGIGANFIPATLDRQIYDEVLPVTDDDAIAATRELNRKESILCGISSGAAVFAARTVAKRPQWQDKVIVTILPDSGERYLSTGIFSGDQ